MTTGERRTAAVVLNWRRPDDTIACVASLVALDRALDIVVVDNDSGDGSLERLSAELPRLVAGRDDIAFAHAAPDRAVGWPGDGRRRLWLVPSGRNGGYAFGNNVGARIALQCADTAFVWILNNDTLVPGAESLDALVARMDADPGIGICGSTVVYQGGERGIQTRAGSQFQPRRGRFLPIGVGEAPSTPVDPHAIERRLAYINGAAAFVRRAVYETVGPMREDFFLYFEEYDWARRLAPRFRLGYAPASVVLHAVGSTIGTDDSGAGSALSLYYLARNRVRTIARHAPAALLPAIGDELLGAARAWRRGHRQQARAVLRALTGRSFAP